MSALGIQALMEALVTALKANSALAAFSITDRPAAPDQLPHIRLGPVAQEPWSTNTSNGARITVQLGLTSRSGSYVALVEASEAITARIEAAPLNITGATSVIQQVTSVRLEHDPAQALERARLTLEFLLDLGERA
ncbi:MAG: DUF3168 domain-containing protein [Devosiaceae bacterium]